MAYIGKTPTIGNFQVCDAISVVNGQAAYTMQVGSVNVSPESANHMLVSLNGILQKAGSSFTVSGSTITFASNLVTGDVIDFIQILGNVLDLGVPSDSTVSLAKLTATGTKSSSTFLRGDNSFAVPSSDFVHIKTQTVSSGVSSVDFVNGSSDVVFDGTYKRYMIFLQDLITADDNSAQARVRISTNGGSSYITSGYLSSGYRVYAKDGGSGSDIQFQNNSFDLININLKTSLDGGGVNGVFYLTDPTVTRNQQFWSDVNGHDNEWNIRQMSGGVYTTNATINAFQIVCLSSNIAGGVFSLYGLKTS